MVWIKKGYNKQLIHKISTNRNVIIPINIRLIPAIHNNYVL